MSKERLEINRIVSLQLEGYRPFGTFRANLSPLEVIVGANGAGKSSLFEFLRFLRDGALRDIPPEIVAGSIGQQVFHRPGPDKFSWWMIMDASTSSYARYMGEVSGAIGRAHVAFEGMDTLPRGTAEADFYTIADRTDKEKHDDFMVMHDGRGYVRQPGSTKTVRQDLHLIRPTQLALSVMTNPQLATLYDLREFVTGWRFYRALDVNGTAIRRSVPIEQEPVLHEDCRNLSAVLFYLMTEHPLVFDALKAHLRSSIPGFGDLSVKARGGPGEIIAFWQEKGVDSELSLADLSDGILRFLCWSVLSLTPKPPTLICIDEPDQGLHPRTLPILAGLFKKASQRTQLLLATHSSYFLIQFSISQIAVMKKINGESRYFKPSDSAALMANLQDFGITELEAMHRSDELEILA